MLDWIFNWIGERMMGEQQPPQRCKTVREVQLEDLLAEALPVIVDVEMSPSTDEKYRSLIARIEAALQQ